MILTFIKKHWFSMAVALVLLTAIARKNIRFQTAQPGAPEKAPKQHLEKYTEDTRVAQNPSLLGIGPDGGGSAVRLPEIGAAAAVAFLKRFSQVAVAEQQKFGMPASVLLACAYVNSFAGQRACATEANNYLAVPCTAEWGGPVATFSGTCFRKYNTPWESIRDFNLYLHKREWYVALKKSAPRDWRAWAKALSKHRVSDVENFEATLSRVIEQYRLAELDE